MTGSPTVGIALSSEFEELLGPVFDLKVEIRMFHADLAYSSVIGGILIESLDSLLVSADPVGPQLPFAIIRIWH